MTPIIMKGNCSELLDDDIFVRSVVNNNIDLTFLDPPFNQDKDYNEWDDDMPEEKYWGWLRGICTKVHHLTSKGGAIYFMQREKNTEHVLQCLRESGWIFQNLIVWKKKTSAVPGLGRYGKHYQIIAFGTKGERPRMFHRLRINPPLPVGYKYERENGMYVTDVWDDIREMTSGYFAGDEALRDKQGNRLHKQQSPIQLLFRIILSSTNPGDVVLDPFAGTGTTLVVAHQLGRQAVGIEIDKANVKLIEKRIEDEREADNVLRFYKDYEYTPDIKKILGIEGKHLETMTKKNKARQRNLFEPEAKE